MSPFMAFLISGLILLLIPLICFLTFMCLRIYKLKHQQRTVYGSPVIVTSSTHTTAAGPYPVTVAVPAATIQQTSAQYGHPGVYPMPQPQTGGYPAPYPPTQTQQAAPYPPASTAGGSMPMPGGNPSAMNPPSYDQVVGNDAYQKQAPYNPGYNAN
ncbi:MAPK-interacting and spindle-stabilizing protein-like isoform X2 [Lutzomyia longipalpis]|uniref:MAPK-interacting and spindle-stabilizing protein-like isoform X2 n=1 Tax=Lutzomyia longipalpis TaxID=7200 RepID=UPI0024834E49|nr:MAPK-interacting and spindle-stabilizing protein-like isoform X2 [Lutzomyia longipalpis]